MKRTDSGLYAAKATTPLRSTASWIAWSPRCGRTNATPNLLEARVQEADESVDAIRRTFLAAQQTKQEMITEGATRADQIVANAQQRRGPAPPDCPRVKIDTMHFERDQVIIEAHGRWEKLVTEADEASFEMMLEAETARASAIGDRQHVIELSERAAEARLATATEEADRIANEIVGEASREELRISARLDHLRAAITEVETKIHDLAAVATPYTEQIADIIDLTDVEEDQPMAGSGRS